MSSESKAGTVMHENELHSALGGAGGDPGSPVNESDRERLKQIEESKKRSSSPKITLLVINLFFFITGAAMSGLAGVALSRRGPVPEAFPKEGLEALLAASFTLVVTAIMGFYGAFAENKPILACYACIATFAIIFEIAAAAVIVAFSDEIVKATSDNKSAVKTSVNEAIDKAVTGTINVCCPGWQDRSASYQSALADYHKTGDNSTLNFVITDHETVCGWLGADTINSDNCNSNSKMRDALIIVVSDALKPIGVAITVLGVFELLALSCACVVLCRAKGAVSLFDDDEDTSRPPVPLREPMPEYPIHSDPSKEFWPFVLVFNISTRKKRKFAYETIAKIVEPLPKTDVKDITARLPPIDVCAFKSVNDEELFVKVRCKTEILIDEAHRQQMPLRVNPMELKLRDLAANKKERGNHIFAMEKKDATPAMKAMRGTLLMEIPDGASPWNPYHFIYAPFNRDEADIKLYRKDRITRTIFRTADVLKLVVSILENRVGITLDDVDEFFPLHDRTERLRLKAKWFRWLGSPWDQPVNDIRNYFGEKVALYFAWLGHYTKWLVSPACIGLAVYIHQNVAQNTSVQELPWYGLFVAVWATLFLEFWKRNQSRYAMEWGMNGFEARESNRPQFDKFEGIVSTSVRASPVSGLQETYYNDYVYKSKIVISQYVVGMLVVVVLSCVLGIFVMKRILNKAEKEGEMPHGSAGYLAAAVNAIQIQVLNLIYGKVARRLNDWENHRTDTMYEDNLIAKTFLFQFINSYFSLFYIAFLKNNVAVDGGDVPEGCLPNAQTGAAHDCLGELQSQLGVIFLTRLFVGNFVEIVIPLIKAHIEKKKYDELKAQGVAEKRSPAERQNMLADYETFDDYSEMVIQFGYVTLFVVAFPLAPLLALVSNYVEIRVDALKLLERNCRPEPRGAEDIGTWYNILETMGTIAAITNLAVVTFSSNAPFFGSTGEMRIWIFVIFEHAVLATKALFAYFVADVPWQVQLQLDRADYLVNKHFNGVGDVVELYSSVVEDDVEEEESATPDPATKSRRYSTLAGMTDEHTKKKEKVKERSDEEKTAANAAFAEALKKGLGITVREKDPSPVEHEADDVAEGKAVSDV